MIECHKLLVKLRFLFVFNKQTVQTTCSLYCVFNGLLLMSHLSSVYTLRVLVYSVCVCVSFTCTVISQSIVVLYI